jgi:NDP-sugar pyrophosphorylase family protein
MVPQAVILLGGRGTRIAAQYPDRPKALVPVCGRPFLEWQLDWLRAGGITRVLLAAGHLADVLERHLAARPPDGLDLVLSREPEPLGTGGALKFAEPLLASDPVLVLNGDSLAPRLDVSTLWKKVFHSVENSGPVFPWCGQWTGDFSTVWKNLFHGVEKNGGFFPHRGKLFVTPIGDPGRYGTVEFGDDGFVSAFREKAECRSGFVNAGVYLLPREIIEAIPAGRAVSLETEIFPDLAARRRLLALPAPPPLLDMGTPGGLTALEDFLRRPE